jgi:hypothetical protein
MNTVDFRLIQAFSWSNSHTSSIIILCCGKIMSSFPQMCCGLLLYSQENYLIYMASFRLCYNLNKHTSDMDSILALHPTSWTVAAIGPLIRVNLCSIITSPWTCCQPGHIGSRLDCQAIGTTDQTPPWTSSLIHRVHFFFFTRPLALILRCFFNPMPYQIDDVFDTHWWVYHRYQLLHGRHISVYFFWKSKSSVCPVHDARFTKQRP